MSTVSLAEPRRRQKWTLNPRGNLWANDENKFGHKLMEKMGWEKGKGLGANQDGMVTHVKVRQKDNQKGVGFEGHDDTWLAHQDDFQAVLAALNVEHGSAGEGMTETEKKASLEAISRKSKRRVHYQKFVKGKDSSNYSADDLGCILGTKSEKVGAKAKAVEEEAKGVEEEDNGKFKQASGSYQDYFAAKMAALKAQGRFKEVPEWKEENTLGGQTLGLGAGNGRAVDREIQRESLLCPDYLKAARDQSATDKEETVEEQEGEVEVASVTKKRKRQREVQSTEGAPEEQEVEAEAGQVAKKRKRQTEKSVETDIVEISEDQEAVKKSKKKKKDTKESSPASERVDADVDAIEASEPPVKKKKKKNKKDVDLGQTTDASTEDVEKQRSGNIGEESHDETINRSKKKKKKSDRITPEEVQEQEVLETKAECDEEKVKKKKSKKSKKEKSSDAEMEAVADSGCEEVSDVKVKKTKKSKKEKTKPDVESNVESHSKKDISVSTSVHGSTETACQEVDSGENAKKKKKKSKKNKSADDEEQVVPEVEDQVLLKNYREAPGVLKGSNILAIPGYGASKLC